MALAPSMRMNAKHPEHAIELLSETDLAEVTGGDNPGMGPYDAPPPAPAYSPGKCVFTINDIVINVGDCQIS